MAPPAAPPAKLCGRARGQGRHGGHEDEVAVARSIVCALPREPHIVLDERQDYHAHIFRKGGHRGGIKANQACPVRSRTRATRATRNSSTVVRASGNQHAIKYVRPTALEKQLSGGSMCMLTSLWTMM